MRPRTGLKACVVAKPRTFCLGQTGQMKVFPIITMNGEVECFCLNKFEQLLQGLCGVIKIVAKKKKKKTCATLKCLTCLSVNSELIQDAR